MTGHMFISILYSKTGVYRGLHYFSYFCEAVLTSTHNLCFVQKYEKYQNVLSENFHLFGGKICNIVE